MKTIFITGSSSGIGKSTAKYFADNGWNVVATMRSPNKETELNQMQNVLVTRLDVEDRETIDDAINKAIKKFGKIDVLLNNAGFGSMGVFESATDEQISKQFAVNVFGTMHMTRAILPHFRSNKEGKIINMSSMGGRISFPAMSLYNASKFAIEGFTEALAFELATQNINIKLIEPGVIDTDFYDRSMNLYFEKSPEDYNDFKNKLKARLEKIKENLSSPEMVAESIYKAANDNSNQIRYIVGQDAAVLIKMQQKKNDVDFKKLIEKMFC